jgi:DNA-binding NarL/FixJ family response regulator
VESATATGRSALANAAAGFESLGMPAMLERTARVAERIGATLPGASKRTSDPRTLAAPEIDVLRRIARGRNAHQIADELAMLDVRRAPHPGGARQDRRRRW